MATETTDKFNARDVAIKLKAQERVADVPFAKLVKALMAISLGTMIECKNVQDTCIGMLKYTIRRSDIVPTPQALLKDLLGIALSRLSPQP